VGKNENRGAQIKTEGIEKCNICGRALKRRIMNCRSYRINESRLRSANGDEEHLS